MIDGVSALDPQVNGVTNNLRIAEAVQEFSVTTSAASAEFGRQSGAQVNMVTKNLEKALGLDRQTTRQVASQMALAGYIEPVSRKKETRHNTEAGNTLADTRPPRLTRVKAEGLLADLEDRAAEFNMRDSHGARIQQVVAFGSMLTEHDPIQEIDIGVQLTPLPGGQARRAQEMEVMMFLKGRSPALKLHRWDAALDHMPARVLWKA
jgi:hypothetical protein